MAGTGPAHPFARLAIAAIVTAVWLLALAGLAIFTANPITLNRHQIETAELVVTGRVVDRDTGEVAVERTWKGTAPADQFRVRNLAETPAAAGDVYILPLTTARGGLVVTPARRRSADREAGRRPPDAGGPSLIYPATPDALQQLQRALAGSEA